MSLGANPLDQQLRRFAAVAAATAALIGVLALLGWLAHVPALVRFDASFASTKFNSAVTILLLGGALLAATTGRVTAGPGQMATRARSQLTTRLLASFALVIAIATLAEYWSGADLHIDELLARDDLTVPAAGVPGRMSLATAAVLLLLAVAVLLTDVRTRSGLYPSQWLGALVAAVALFELLGYVYGVRALYSVPAFGTVALPTAIALLLLSAGCLAARPEHGFMPIVSADDAGGVLVRRLLPATVLVPAVAGWLRLRGQRAGLYGMEFGLALFVASTTVVFTVLVCLVAQALRRAEAVRRSSEHRLGVSEQRVRAIFDTAPDGVATLDLGGRFLELNHSAETLIGRSGVEVGGLEFAEVVLPDDQRRAFRAWFTSCAADGEVGVRARRIELDGERIDGSRIPLEISVKRMPGGGQALFAVSLRDITERRQQDATRARLANIVLSSDDAIVSKSLDGIIASWNPGAERLFGYSAAEAIGHPMLMLFPPERAEEEAEFLKRLARGDSIDHFETQRVRKDGTIIDVSVTISPVRNARAEIVGASTIARDISERRGAAARMQVQLSRMHLMAAITRAIGERHDVRSIFQVVIRRLEDDMPIDIGCVALNDGAPDALRVAVVGARGAPPALDLALPENSRIEVDQNGLAQCVRGQLVYEPELATLTSPFAQKLAAAGLNCAVFAPLLVESKTFGVLVAARRETRGFTSADCEFLRQLSEHVALASHESETYAALQRAYEDLRQTQQAMMQQERLRVLGQLASGVAHDLNNALSPAAVYAHLLLERQVGLSAEAREQLELIQRAIEDAARTVSRMREFSRLRDQAVELAPVSLPEAIQHAIALTRSSWQDTPNRGGAVVDVRTDLEPGLPAVLGAESEIRDAVVNLILNAIDAMPRGGTLTLRTRRRPAAGDHEEMFALEVEDTGSGMSEETRRRCLEPFFSTKGRRGTGLGLAMAFGTMQRHGGELVIDSELGRGTVVRLLFRTPATGPAGVAERVERRPSRRLHVLVVDDDPLVLRTLRELMAADGHLVTAADGGQAGIDAFQAALTAGERFDIVITDLGMPYVDGRRVAAAIKSAAPDVPIIMLTGWGQDADIRGDASLRADRVIGKPPRLALLRHALAELTDPKA